MESQKKRTYIQVFDAKWEPYSMGSICFDIIHQQKKQISQLIENYLHRYQQIKSEESMPISVLKVGSYSIMIKAKL